MSVHVTELKVPDALLKVTVPAGVIVVPVEASMVVTVHVVGAFTGTETGAQLTFVEVERLVAARLTLTELVEWSVSPA